MLQNWFLLLATLGAVLCYPNLFDTKKFSFGIEYDHSLPMSGGSDRYRHRNNYDPFYITVTTYAKKGYVFTYLEVTATCDADGEVEFTLARGAPGSYQVTFQLVSNHTDFLSYSYMAYGIREDEYRKMANIITMPMTNGGTRLQHNGSKNLSLIIILLYLLTVKL